MLSSELATARWRKSSRSGNTSNCVEVAGWQGLVFVRDSKCPEGPALAFTTAEWDVFLDGVKSQRFDS